jgi:hypothetical protein
MSLKQDVLLFVDGPLGGTWKYVEEECPVLPDEYYHKDSPEQVYGVSTLEYAGNSDVYIGLYSHVPRSE